MKRTPRALALPALLLLLSGCNRGNAAPPPAVDQAGPKTLPGGAASAPESTAGTLPASADDIAPEPFIVAAVRPCSDISVAYQHARRWSYPTRKRAPKVAAGESMAGATAADDGLVAPPPAQVSGEAKKAEAQPAPAGEAIAGERTVARAAGDQVLAAGRAGRERTPTAARDSRRRAAAPLTRYLSADDSNSTASPAIVRKLIRLRQYVHPDYVRTYEFLNYADFEYQPPIGTEIAVHPELRAGMVAGEYQMQIGIRALDRARDAMPPLNVTFLLDISGSMAGEPFTLAKAFIEQVAGHLRPGEQVAVVAFNRHPRTLLEPQTVSEHTAASVEQALSGIAPTDITDLEAGIRAAYELAARSYDASRTNRVVIVSDGAANAGKMSRQMIAKHAADMDRQGIYLAGVAVGAGLDDNLMNTVTDAGRGAYLFIDSQAEIRRLLADDRFVATFDLAVKDVRLKLVLPPGFAIKEFHGEQMSAVASEVVPQYLAPNDQMIYHLVVKTALAEAEAAVAPWELEAEYRPIGGPVKKVTVRRATSEMLVGGAAVKKGDAIVRYAEALKRIGYPLEENRAVNLAQLDAALADVARTYAELRDRDLRDIIALMKAYRRTLAEGEQSTVACDRQFESPPVVLGLAPEQVRRVIVKGPRPQRAVRTLHQLLGSTRLLPLEGFRFLALGSGPVGSRYPASTGELSYREYLDPIPRFMGDRRNRKYRGDAVYDLHQVVLDLTAPPDARSFSFDFNYFSAEYPEFVNQSYNDTFYAILEAPSTNGGKSTNISFDPNHNAIEVDNNYFESPFHPIPNTHTGFDRDGSTGWLRTSWPIQANEEFSLTFSIHDEGDGIYDSVVLIDNFRFHDFDAVGNTDPLN
ncbi:MAG: VWA domain-containing protein [Deltaproteobacteria bacterium]|nr:VWA domain-containing protein [Deltaproteobacteria bacterium]